MANVAIYYQQIDQETIDQAIERVGKFIKKIDTQHTVKGVFIDPLNGSNELLDLLNYPLGEIDIIFINKSFDNEFDQELIIQLSSTEHFKICLFRDV